MKKHRSKILCGLAFIVFVLAASSSALASNALHFPGKISELKSPNGLYTVKNVDKSIGNVPSDKYSSLPGDDGATDGHYLLFLRNGQKEKVVLKSYSRDVDILWSPDSSAFIVNDYVASDTTIPYLYRVKDLAHPVDIGDKFIDSIKDKKDKSSLDNSLWMHIFGARWLGFHSVEIRAVGNSTGPVGHTYSPFTLVYSWDLGNSFRRIKRIAEEDWSTDVPKPKY